MSDIFSGYTDEEAEKIKTTIDHLYECANPEHITFVGSLPIRYFFELRDVPFESKNLNDLDLIMPTLESFNAKTSDHFAIYHTHSYPNYQELEFSFKFFAAMVNKQTGVRVDIFSEYPYKPQRVIELPYRDKTIKFQSAEDQLITQVLEGERILFETEPYKLDRKRKDIISGLQKAVDVKLAEKYWEERDLASENRTLKSAIDKIESYIKENGEEALKIVAAKPARECGECVEIQNLPLCKPEEANKYLGF